MTGLFALAIAMTIGLPPVSAAVTGRWTPLLGLLAALVLFGVVVRRRPFTRPSAAAAFVLMVRAALEELFWRGLVLAALSLALGAIGGLALSSAAFSGFHRRRRLHFVTGLAFGALYVCSGKLLTPILAHAAYNVLVCSTLPPAELRRVRKRFGDRVALDDVDLEVGHGEVLALLGPNGSGKSTAVSLLLGLRRPDAGGARLFGTDPTRPRARAAVGAVPQEIDLPHALRVREIVDLVRAHHADPEPRQALLARFGLEPLVGRQAGGLSLGERRRVALALAFAGRPRALFLDEPSAGLDLEWRRELWHELREHAGRGGAVLLTTHYLEEAAALADVVVVLAGGRVVARGTIAELRAGRPLEEVYLALTAR